jgi:4-hydroxythreonine-4-phosphate dehydrogenase
MGDPAGIGGECTVRLPRDARAPFLVLDDPERLARLGAPVERIDSVEQARHVWPHSIPVLPVPLAVTPVPGRPDARNAGAVIDSIERAVALARSGAVAGVVTNPISKAILHGAGFGFPGHTEFLGALTGVDHPVMMLCSPLLRVVPVTVHLGLRQAIESLTSGLIVATARTTAAALARDFGVARPRLALSGLNPHAGEGGAFGDEEAQILAPAIAALRAEGIDATGPHPADSMFTPDARATYDAALCMYHDQALIPLKTLDRDHGVNVTLGLPIIRTSPDHGTAFDIAGTGRANPTSLLAALHLAAAMARTHGGGD